VTSPLLTASSPNCQGVGASFDTLFVGLAPGLAGIYQMDTKISALTATTQPYHLRMSDGCLNGCLQILCPGGVQLRKHCAGQLGQGQRRTTTTQPAYYDLGDLQELDGLIAARVKTPHAKLQQARVQTAGETLRRLAREER